MWIYLPEVHYDAISIHLTDLIYVYQPLIRIIRTTVSQNYF